MISGSTPRTISEGGYGNAGEHPERLRSGEAGGVLPSPSTSRPQPSLPPTALPPKAKNSRPSGGTTGGRNAAACGRSKGKNVGYPEGIFAFPDEEKKPSPPLLLGGDNCHIRKLDLKEFDGTVGVDWLQGTIPVEHSASLFDYFSRMCGGPPEIFKWGRFCYDRHCEWHPYGITMYWDTDSEKRLMHRNRVTIQLTGQTLNAFSASALFQLFKDLSTTFEFSATRIDLCFDDYQKTKMPHEVSEIAGESNFTGFRRWEPRQSRHVSGKYISDGIYFGQRGKKGSGRFLRCYDKSLESEGVIDAVRWEVEFTKDHSKQVFDKLAETQDIETFAGLIGALIGGSIDFIDRKGAHVDRMKRLDWWQRIRDILGSVKLRNPERIKSIDKTVGWVEKSVSASLEKVRRAYGDEEFYIWLDNSVKGSRLKKLAHAEIRDYHDKKGIPKNYSCCPF